jgi:hypothetical protein
MRVKEVFMANKESLDKNALDWLLEPEQPGIRYLALRDLCDVPMDDPELVKARRKAHQEGPIAEILSQMNPSGYWVKAGPGYGPKYKSTVWSIIHLAELGGCLSEDERIRTAGMYLLDHALAAGGKFSYNGTPSGTFDCLQGNLCWALMELGCEDARLKGAVEWMARTVTGEGLAPASDRQAEQRYYQYKCGPNFACGVNAKLPCAWGAVKVMLALEKVSKNERTSLIERAIHHGVDFLFSVDPATADYPSPGTGKPNQSWWKFGFPVFYVTDIPQIVEALRQAGYGEDPRLKNARDYVRGKQDEQGRWALEYDYAGKSWGQYGAKRQPNKWVTYRALKALKEN